VAIDLPHGGAAEADPQELGGLYDAGLALFNHFVQARSTGISIGKISKVLHVERPALFPILDSRVRRAYRRRARVAAAQHNSCRPATVRYAYWAAIREDVTNPRNVDALHLLRRALRESERQLVARAAGLSDVRLLDVLTWNTAT
jgi:hypothetical protein